MDCHFRDLPLIIKSCLGTLEIPEFRGTITDKLMANPENNSP